MLGLANGYPFKSGIARFLGIQYNQIQGDVNLLLAIVWQSNKLKNVFRGYFSPNSSRAGEIWVSIVSSK